MPECRFINDCQAYELRETYRHQGILEPDFPVICDTQGPDLSDRCPLYDIHAAIDDIQNGTPGIEQACTDTEQSEDTEGIPV